MKLKYPERKISSAISIVILIFNEVSEDQEPYKDIF